MLYSHGPAATVGDYIKHAERFGCELVAETAKYDLDPRGLVRLQIALDELERNETGRFGYSTGHRRRLSPDELKERVSVLHGDGLTLKAIADKLAVPDRRVKEVLRELEALERAA